MPNTYQIITDSCSDLPISFVNKEEIPVAPLHLLIGETSYQDDLGQSLSHENFYREIDNGALPMTSQPTPESFYQLFKKEIEKGKDVLYIGVSSGLSGTYNSSNIAKAMIEEEYPESVVVCFTTLIGSLGQALFVQEALALQKEGKSMSDVVSHLEGKVKSQKNLIVVNDLSHLKRGGRISGLQSAVGSILKVHPILQIDKDGKVSNLDKIRGRNKALKKLVEFTIQNIEEPENQTIAISHANALEDAIKVKEEIEKELKVKNFLIESIGPVVGSHSGTGAIAIFFLN